MSLENQMKTGQIYIEYDHAAEEDKTYEKVIEEQRKVCKDLVYDYNHARPSEYDKKGEILKQVLGGMGEKIWIEAPVAFSYGCNTYMGNHVYANYNLTIVDDRDVYIGDYVMFGPNVTITATGHPVHPLFRKKGGQFSIPVHIESGVWIGANVVVMPGVTIGENSVIGAGSVVTKDIPANSIAFGSPCKVVREINDKDLVYYRKGVKVNEDWDV